MLVAVRMAPVERDDVRPIMCGPLSSRMPSGIERAPARANGRVPIFHHEFCKRKPKAIRITQRDGREERKKIDKPGGPKGRSSVDTRPPVGRNC
jgi:hypothetical protein